MVSDPPESILAQRLRTARLAAKLTQQDLAGETFSKSYISAVEQGRMIPSIPSLSVLAARLGVAMSYLLGESDLELSAMDRLCYAEQSWAIETYHRGLKQHCGVERCQVRRSVAQRNHIGFAIRAFLRLESYCWDHGWSWFDAKADIIREAVRLYLAKPKFILAQGA